VLYLTINELPFMQECQRFDSRGGQKDIFFSYNKNIRQGSIPDGNRKKIFFMHILLLCYLLLF
jgi:hypothetical protein